MPLGPDDLPDPFGEGGMSQLICACTSEAFHFVFTDKTVRAICASCKAQGGEWLKEPAPERFGKYQVIAREPGTYTIDLNTGQVESFQPSEWPQQRWQGPAQPAPPVAGAGWGDAPVPPPERGPLTDDARKGILPPPPLPAFSAGMCNAYLDGGPYDGQITWLMAGDASQDFHVSGWATYKATSKTRDGRIVYAFKED